MAGYANLDNGHLPSRHTHLLLDQLHLLVVVCLAVAINVEGEIVVALPWDRALLALAVDTGPGTSTLGEEERVWRQRQPRPMAEKARRGMMGSGIGMGIGRE